MNEHTKEVLCVFRDHSLFIYYLSSCIGLCPLFVSLAFVLSLLYLSFSPSIFLRLILLLLLSLRKANVKTMTKETSWNQLYNFLDKLDLDALLGHCFLDIATVFFINM